MNPGSPKFFTLSIIFSNSSRVTLFLSSRAELFERPRCPFETNQFPVLAFTMSVSSALNKLRQALRLTPPAITESEAWQMMSMASIGLRWV